MCSVVRTVWYVLCDDWSDVTIVTTGGSGFPVARTDVDIPTDD